MSYVLAAAGFMALIVLHEFGHFAAAKAVGMRVERFSLFFGPMLVKVRRGETEYGIGPIPLGGYVKITGMNPHEEIPPEHADRAYFRQPVWKRIVVIAAGPVMNILIAFAILWAIFVIHGTEQPSHRVDQVEKRQPATGVLQPGDRIVSVDGRTGSLDTLSRQIASHRCAGTPTAGCVAATPARIVVDRDGVRRTFVLRPRYDAALKKTRVGFSFGSVAHRENPAEAVALSGKAIWRVSKGTVSAVARIFDPQQRKQISGVVGTYDVTRQAISFDSTQAFLVLAIISLSLAIVNLFPFLPLDGGHIFWALAEKVRGRPIPFSIMERAGALGFVLVIMLFVIGLTNDIDRLRGTGFSVR